MTNFERIKAMSVEEMASFLTEPTVCHFCARKEQCAKLPYFYCKNCLTKWLESEVEENEQS